MDLLIHGCGASTVRCEKTWVGILSGLRFNSLYSLVNYDEVTGDMFTEEVVKQNKRSE